VALEKNFETNLKASTALKYGKMGASILTVNMSRKNVQSMFDSFRSSNYAKFLGSTDFESNDLGYLFLNSQAKNISVRFIQK
jgi:hypothetical protein